NTGGGQRRSHRSTPELRRPPPCRWPEHRREPPSAAVPVARAPPWTAAGGGC
ncbi:hypothetical protein A2U01_0116934, partial [Trifolium medium]|nr:hypothetical protein [Trifolium medium]